MAKITVNSAQLRSRANDLESYKNQLRTAVNNLRNDKVSLGKDWSGDSWDEFSKYFERNYQQFLDFIAGVEQYIRVLREAADRYDKAESKNVGTAKTC